MTAASRPRRKARRRPSAAKDGPLTRGGIVAAALGVVDRAGVEGLSMRALAAELGVTPMALYNHVGGKQDLLRAIAEAVLAEVSFDNGATDWPARVADCLRALRAACLRHPGAPRLFEIYGVAPASVFAPMRVVVDALIGAGLEPEDALKAYFALIAFTLGQADYQTRGPFAGMDPAAAAAEGRLDAGLAAMLAPVLAGDWDFDAAFEFGLQLILAGVETAVGRREG